MNLIEQANEIIDQKSHTDEDITSLQKIKFRMSRLYDEYSTNAGMQEQLYNQLRSEEYIKAKKKAKTSDKKYTEAELEWVAKAKAEERYGDFRLFKARASSFKVVIEAIQSFCIDYYFRQKQLLDVTR